MGGAVAVGLLLARAVALAGDAGVEPRPGIYALYRDFDALPGITDQDIRALWARAIEDETAGRQLAAARCYREIVHRLPGESHAYWRLARTYWRHGDRQTDDTRRVEYFGLARRWAERGLAVDAECGACCLYEFLAMASTATTRGIFSAMSEARGMAAALDRGIRLRPMEADNEWNTTLGNLYVAASHFYRVTPESFWLKLAIGVAGDRERAVAYARAAHAMASMRVDYTVALGAALLCAGTADDAPVLVSEGSAVLRRVPDLPTLRPEVDANYRRHAIELAARPERACDYSPDGWVDVEGALAQSDAPR